MLALTIRTGALVPVNRKTFQALIKTNLNYENTLFFFAFERSEHVTAMRIFNVILFR